MILEADYIVPPENLMISNLNILKIGATSGLFYMEKVLSLAPKVWFIGNLLLLLFESPWSFCDSLVFLEFMMKVLVFHL